MRKQFISFFLLVSLASIPKTAASNSDDTSLNAWGSPKGKRIVPSAGVATGGCRVGGSMLRLSENDLIKRIMDRLNSKGMKQYLESLVVHMKNQTVECSLTLDDTGGITKLEVSKSSGQQDIDLEAVELIKRAGPYEPSLEMVLKTYLIELPSIKVIPNNLKSKVP